MSRAAIMFGLITAAWLAVAVVTGQDDDYLRGGLVATGVVVILERYDARRQRRAKIKHWSGD